MTLPPPPYIPVQHLQAHETSFEWDDWDPEAIIPPSSSALVHRLNSISNNGGTAFALGCAEWTVYSLARHLKNDLAYLYIDAFWLFCCSGEAMSPPETDEEEWVGPYLGATNLALMTVLNTIIESEFGPAGRYGALASSLACHVTGANKAFLNWQASVLDRLASKFPRNVGDPDGKAVPREMLDPTVPLEQLDTDAAADEWARMIIASDNPLILEDDEDDDD